MKSEVNKPVTNKYPALYENEDGDVLLVIEDGGTTLIGIIVKSDNIYSVGLHSTCWLKSNWKRMESGTTLTLTQS